MSLSLVVPLVAAGLTLPLSQGRRPARVPSHAAAGALVRERRGYTWHPAHLAVAPLVVWIAAGWISALVFAVLVVVVRFQVRNQRQRAVARRLHEEVPLVLQDIARKLRAGYPAGLGFAEALGAARGRAGGSYAANMLVRGEPLVAAVARWHDDVSRVAGPSVLDDLVHIVAVAERVGGLRASAVEAVADLASERRALAQETSAQASQAKASATVMTIAPLIFSAQMVLRDPVASEVLLRTPIGWVLITVGLSFDAAAWLWIRRATVGRRVPTRRSTDPGLRGRAALASWRSALIAHVVATALPGRRLDALVPRPSAPMGATRVPLFERIGAAVERISVELQARFELVGVLPRASQPRVASSTERRRRMGATAVLLPPLLLLRPFLGILAVIIVVVGPRLHERFARQRQRRDRVAAVGHTIELVRSALECGATPSVALLVVAEVTTSAVRPALQSAAADLRQGASFDDVVRRLLVSAPELRSMADVLLASSRLGLPVVETLRGLAVEARASRRREAEARARRLPVILLFPVVCLTLPAFVLLTVAPLLLSGLGALHL